MVGEKSCRCHWIVWKEATQCKKHTPKMHHLNKTNRSFRSITWETSWNMIKNNFAIRVSLNFIHLFEYKLHKYAPKTPCHLRFAAFPPYMSLRRFVCGDKNLKKQIVFVVESSQLGWRCLKTPGNLRRVQHPMRTISHQFIYTWPMNKNDRISRWRHSRICGGTSVVQPHGVELFNFQTRDLWASLTPMSKLAPFSENLAEWTQTNLLN